MEPETQKPTIASVEKVTKTYHNGVPTQVLFDIDLEINRGDFTAIRGASGSGKSTLLNLVGLLDRPTSGKIFLDGKDTSTLGEDELAMMRRDYLGFIFQFHYLLPEFNVLENALMPCRIKGKDAEEENHDRVVEMLEVVGLGHRLDHRPSQISGGEQQRVAVVRALANSPLLVLADEPTGDLDRKTSEAVAELLRELNRVSETAFLIVTHEEALAEQCDLILDMVDGRIDGID
ncbi:MAG: ABC transporter ATP-binding protein [Bradymonadaceae bacterium]